MDGPKQKEAFLKRGVSLSDTLYPLFPPLRFYHFMVNPEESIKDNNYLQLTKLWGCSSDETRKRFMERFELEKKNTPTITLEISILQD